MVKSLSQIVDRTIINTYRTDICIERDACCIERDAYTGDGTNAIKLFGNCFQFYLFLKPG